MHIVLSFESPRDLMLLSCSLKLMRSENSEDRYNSFKEEWLACKLLSIIIHLLSLSRNFVYFINSLIFFLYYFSILKNFKLFQLRVIIF